MNGFVGIQSYNTDIKITGNYITFRRFEERQIRGYEKNSRDNILIDLYGNKDLQTHFFSGKYLKEKLKLEWFKIYQPINHIDKYGVKYNFELLRIKALIEIEKKNNWIKSTNRAYQNIIDLVACNTYKHRDFNGRNERTKFMTLTFRENVKSIKLANKELTNFMKRLSYRLYGIKKNVIKYIAVPELQKRGVWHFHLIVFNMAYVEHSVLMKEWGNGGVGINAIKGSAGYTARYVAKYLSKGTKIVDDTIQCDDDDKDKVITYELYKKLGLQNMKRYSSSKGLHKPTKCYIDLNSDEFEDIISVVCDINNLEKMNESGDKIETFNYSNEHRGDITKIRVVVKHKYLKDIRKMLLDINVMKLKRKAFKRELTEEDWWKLYQKKFIA